MQEITATAAESPVLRRMAESGRGSLIFPVVSLVLLIPCFWQSRIQAGDLSSHLYNAWLAQLIRQGRAPGLTLVHPTTNILFDWMLSAFFPFGTSLAQRIPVSIAVLTFVWGAFAFASAVSRRRVWHMLPPIVMLAYGWVFRMGFFNFYMSLGLCFGAAALLWRCRSRRALLAVPLLTLAWLAHALPVVWAAAILGYAYAARCVPERRRLAFAAAAAVAIGAARIVLTSAWKTLWFPTQMIDATGLHQVRLFDEKYAAVMLGLLLIWVLAAADLANEHGGWSILRGIPFQVCLLTAVGIAVIPSLIGVPGYKHALAFVAERMGLALGICICAMLGPAPSHPFRHFLCAVVAVLFFAFVYRDERALNALETNIAAVVSQLPPGQRVLNGVNAPDLHVNSLVHMIDRVCVGRCYSYANYEPATWQFRVRAVGESRLVVSTYEDSWKIEVGTYVVQSRDLPIYQVTADGRGRLFLRTLSAGGKTGMSVWNPLCSESWVPPFHHECAGPDTRPGP